MSGDSLIPAANADRTANRTADCTGNRTSDSTANRASAADAAVREPVLSDRLKALAGMVPEGCVLADIGTDHALVPARLLTSGRIRRAIACDVAEGPLRRAEEQLRVSGVSDRAECRLADGLHGLTPGEADVILIAGLGGPLMVRILSEGLDKRNEAGEGFAGTVREWILSPHSEWGEVRQFLREHGLRETEERYLVEDGKRYILMRAVPGDGEEPWRKAAEAGISPEASDCFGPLTALRRADPDVKAYLLKERDKALSILRHLNEEAEQGAGRTEQRKAELMRIAVSAEELLGERIERKTEDKTEDRR